MLMPSDIPGWLSAVAWTYIALSLLSAAYIVRDIYLRRHRGDSVATELVWISSALYLGPFAVVVYRRHERPVSSAVTAGSAGGSAVAVLPGGGASAVAHLIGVPLVVAAGWTIAGMSMWPMIIVIGLLAVMMLAVYERGAGQGVCTGQGRVPSAMSAIMAAVITVAAFDVGMVGWMVLLHLNNAMPPVTDSTFWFLMQVGVVIGLATGYPAVKWLLRRDRSAVPA